MMNHDVTTVAVEARSISHPLGQSLGALVLGLFHFDPF
jgi:hypothetical protein